MGFRFVVISESAKLDYSMGFLCVRKSDVQRIFMREIHTLMIESTAVSMTSALINELISSNIKVIFCDGKHNPSAELLPIYGAHDTSGKIQHQVAWKPDIKNEVWRWIVKEKIRKQAEILDLYGFSSHLLRSYIEEVEEGDRTNREGHAAKVYFNSLFGMNFSRSQDNAINAALNYGYAILLSLFNREIAGRGYLTQIGLFHHGQDNPFNLSSDLMEPFRPLVDRIVKEMMPQEFGTYEKREVLKLFNEMVYISGRSEFLPNAIELYCNNNLIVIKEGTPDELIFYEVR